MASKRLMLDHELPIAFFRGSPPAEVACLYASWQLSAGIASATILHTPKNVSGHPPWITDSVIMATQTPRASILGAANGLPSQAWATLTSKARLSTNQSWKVWSTCAA